MRTRVGLLAIALVCTALGCGSGSEPPRAQGTRVGPTIPGVTFPTLPPVDTGVFRLGSVVRKAAVGERGEIASDGLRYRADSCSLRAPGAWVLRGHVTMPKDEPRATADVLVELARGDEGATAVLRRVTIDGSGQFAIAFATPREPGSGQIVDSASGCSIELLRPSVRVAPEAAQPRQFVETSAVRTPYTYTAPSDSLQALGIGAPLGDRQDPRTQSLYVIWSGESAALDRAYVPVVHGERPALVGLRTTKDSPCTAIDVALTDVGVSTQRDCDEPSGDSPKLTNEPVAGARGFVWASTSLTQRPLAIRRTGRDMVVVQAGPSEPTRARVAEVAASLVVRRNLARSRPAPSRPATLDAAIAQFLDRHPNAKERARFKYRQWWMLAFDGDVESESRTDWSITLVQARKLASGWWIAGGGGGISGDGPPCFTGKIGAGGGDDRYSFAATGDPKWRVEGEVDGTWVSVPAVNGVVFVDRTVAQPKEIPVNLRPVDETGRVPPCWSSQ